MSVRAPPPSTDVIIAYCKMDIYEELLRLRNLGQKCALATIVEVRGSIPSYESAKLLVREDGSMIGTIGGGCVEAEVWNAAREVIETEKPKHLSFNLGQDAAYDNGLICGGQLDVFVEPVLPSRAPSSSAAATSRKASRRSRTWRGSPPLSWMTARASPTASASRKPPKFTPESTKTSSPSSRSTRPATSSSSRAAIATICACSSWAIGTTARYIAMIGSKRKVINVIRELEKEGIPRGEFERIFAPMGLDIGAVSPEEIAISVVAEMIAVRRNSPSNWRALSLSIYAGESIPAVLAK